MKFDDLDATMRRFETAHDHCVLPGLHMVARLDGRGFTRLTRELHAFEAPFDPRFRDMMIATTQHLMTSGFRLVYGYAQSDEISLLFHPEADTFGRKLRKLNSLLAAEASARFSVELGAPRRSTAGSASCLRSETSSTTSDGGPRTRTATR